MRIKEGFFLKTIEDVDYLLPYGNQIASFARGLQLGGCSTFLAERLLEQDYSFEELLDAMEAAYGSEISRTVLQEDLVAFLQSLMRASILEGCGATGDCLCDDVHTFAIAGVHLSVSGPAYLLHPYLMKYEAACSKIDLELRLALYRRPHYELGEFLVRSDDVLIFDAGDSYGILYPENRYVREVVVSKDGSYGSLYVQQDTPEAMEEVFLAMRSAFLVCAQQKGRFAIHSVSLAQDEGVVLFSGVSGAGKSTHGNLWVQHLGATMLNGDINLIGVEAGRVMAYGLPWCGTSEVCTPYAKPLYGVFFIKQDATNHVEELQGPMRALTLSNRMISPTWTRACYEKNLDFACEIQSKLLLANLYCNITPEAAEVSKEYLRDYIGKKDNR